MPSVGNSQMWSGTLKFNRTNPKPVKDMLYRLYSAKPGSKEKIRVKKFTFVGQRLADGVLVKVRMDSKPGMLFRLEAGHPENVYDLVCEFIDINTRKEL